MDISWEQALAWRMGRQLLVERAGPSDVVPVVPVVRRMGGLHAQVMSSVELSLAARVDGITREDVRDALWGRRSLVKLWAMRGTLHVLPADELGAWIGGLRTLRDQYDWMRSPRVDAIVSDVARVLHGEVLTREQLAERTGHPDLLGSWGGYLKPASFHGDLCFGPGNGQRVTFTHPSTWLAKPLEHTDPAAALREIAARYLGAHGPATATELGSWWGTNRAHATGMLEALGDAVTEISVDGTKHWLLTDHVHDLATTTPSEGVVRLLPAFDQWVVCANRRDKGGSRYGPGLPALDPAHRKRIYRLQGWVSPVLLVDGCIAGVWKHLHRGGRLTVEVEPFGSLPGWTRDPLRAETERLAAFFGTEDLALRVPLG